LNKEARLLTPGPFFRGPTLTLGPKGCFLFGSAVDYGEGFRSKQEDLTAHNQPLYDREEYVMWGFSAHRETFALPEKLELPGETLKEAVVALMKNWHPTLVRLIQRAEAPTVTAFAVKTSVALPPWQT